MYILTISERDLQSESNRFCCHLAHKNCTVFCAPNAQKSTGLKQGKKTIFLDV